MNKVEAFEIEQDLTLERAEALLIQCVHYSDYLAEQLKFAQIEAMKKRGAFDHDFAVQIESVVGRDAESRKKQAQSNCFEKWSEWQSADFEADYIKNLLFTNHDKTEALRSILSAKKTVFEKTYNSNQ